MMNLPDCHSLGDEEYFGLGNDHVHGDVMRLDVYLVDELEIVSHAYLCGFGG